MYEIGKKRPDGKYNIWKRCQVLKFHWDWIIDCVCDDLDEAKEYVLINNRKENIAYKVKH
jgi:hypothetical protein